MRLCVGTCGRELVPGKVWDVRPREDRAAWSEVQARLQGRGMCAGCYQAALRAGELIDFPREVRRSPDEVAEDWQHLYDRDATVVQNVATIAPRLGMKPSALRSWYYRHGQHLTKAAA